MRKIACTATLVALASAAAPAGAQSLPTRASLDACHTGAAPLERYAVFSGQMGALPASKRMQVRFDLLQRLPGAGFRRLQAPGLGGWKSSVPGIDIFRYHKQVANLAAPGEYRALVRFRWLSDGGKILQQTVRRTRTCKQPDLRADLAVGQLTAERAAPGRFSYTVVVRNDGRSATPVFSVAFAVGDEAQPPQTVQPLGAGEKRALTFVGPGCDARRPVRVSVDADLAVDEANEGNNARTVVCPATGADAQ